MRASHTHSETKTPPAAMKVRHRTWLLLACATTVGLLVVVLGARVAVQRVLSQDSALFAAVGVSRVVPPKPVPSVTFADDSGHALSLADFKGRAVVLNLWATWCVPCRREMPSLDRLQSKLGGPRFQVVAVSIDRQGNAVVQPFYRELGLRSLGIYLDPSGNAPTALGIDGLPATLLIDADGREIGRKLGALAWDNQTVIDALRTAFGLTDSTPGPSTTPEERNSP
jgi:thiol-disulfide isomerase/thioredoxin